MALKLLEDGPVSRLLEHLHGQLLGRRQSAHPDVGERRHARHQGNVVVLVPEDVNDPNDALEHLGARLGLGLRVDENNEPERERVLRRQLQ